MNKLEKRLVVLDLLIASSKKIKERQKDDLKRVKSYKGNHADAEKLLDTTSKIIKKAKKERQDIIAKLIKAEGAVTKKR